MRCRYVLRANGTEYWFCLKSPNDETILTGTRYTSKASALQAIEDTRVNATFETRYQRRLSSAEEPYFVLRAANNEVLGTSEVYSSSLARDDGIALVKASAPTARIEDQTISPS